MVDTFPARSYFSCMTEAQRSGTARTPTGELLATVEKLARSGTTEDIVEVIRTGARRLIGCDGIAIVIRDGDLCH